MVARPLPRSVSQLHTRTSEGRGTGFCAPNAAAGRVSSTAHYRIRTTVAGCVGTWCTSPNTAKALTAWVPSSSCQAKRRYYGGAAELNIQGGRTRKKTNFILTLKPKSEPLTSFLWGEPFTKCYPLYKSHPLSPSQSVTPSFSLSVPP